MPDESTPTPSQEQQSPAPEAAKPPVAAQPKPQAPPAQPQKQDDALGRQLAAAQRRHRELDARANQLNAEKEALAKQKAELEALNNLPDDEVIERRAKARGISFEDALREMIGSKLGQKQESKPVDPETKKLQQRLEQLEKQLEDEKTEKERIQSEATQRQYAEMIHRDCLDAARETLKTVSEADLFDLAYESEEELALAIRGITAETVQKFKAKFKEPPKDEEIQQFLKEDAGKELLKRWKTSERYKKLSARLSAKAEPARDDKYTRRMRDVNSPERKEAKPKEPEERKPETNAERKARIRRELDNPDIILPGESLIKRVG